MDKYFLSTNSSADRGLLAIAHILRNVTRTLQIKMDILHILRGTYASTVVVKLCFPAPCLGLLPIRTKISSDKCLHLKIQVRRLR